MSGKRPREVAEDVGSEPKKPRKGFSVGPKNLPDGPWRRKVDKVKQNLIVQAKVKKQYAKLKAQHQREEADRKAVPSAPLAGGDDETQGEAAATGEGDADADADAQIHPDRQAMLDDGAEDPSTAPRPDRRVDGDGGDNPNPYPQRQSRKGQRQRQRRPGYFDKSLEEAARKQEVADERAKQAAERQAERSRRLAERERYRKAMAKARAPGADGKRKLGRESKLLLERVKKMVGDGK